MLLDPDVHTRTIPGCTLKVKNPLTNEDKRIIQARIKVLEERLAWNEAQRKLWNEAEIFKIKLVGLAAITEEQRCKRFSARLRRAWAA